MKVRIRAGRGGRDGGRNTAYVERPVQVHQHCNDWVTVDYTDAAGGHDTLGITALIMESEEDLAWFNPGLDGHGTLWNEFKLEVRQEDGKPTTWVFVPREDAPARPGRRRQRRA